MSTDIARNTPAVLKANRRTVGQLLDAADRDTDAASVVIDGVGADAYDRAVIVVKGREHIDYLIALLQRQGLLTAGKPVDGGSA